MRTRIEREQSVGWVATQPTFCGIVTAVCGIAALMFAIIVGGTLATSMLLALILDDDVYYHAEARESKSWSLGPSPWVVVDLSHGSIMVSQSADSSVHAEIRRHFTSKTSQARADEMVESTRLDATLAGGTLKLAGPGVCQSCRAFVDVRLQVPPGTHLELHTGEGDLFVGHIHGGPEMATRIDSPVTLASLKATISSQAYREFDVLIRHPNPTVAGAKPIPLDLESTSGSIAIRGDGVLIDARAPGGDPTLRRASIVYGGRPAPGIHSIRASDGIALELPADLRFEVDAEAPLGSVSCAFPIGDPQTGRPARLKGSTGADPDVTFKLSTSNNAIEIRKRP